MSAFATIARLPAVRVKLPRSVSADAAVAVPPALLIVRLRRLDPPALTDWFAVPVRVTVLPAAAASMVPAFARSPYRLSVNPESVSDAPPSMVRSAVSAFTSSTGAKTVFGI